MNVRILKKENGKLYKASITRMRKADFDKLTETNRFSKFKWDDLRSNYNEVYKLRINGDVVGITQFFYEDMLIKAIEITKLELSKENIGSSREYDHIAGCLIAFACLHSLNHYTGEVYVFYTKETKEIYLNRYGMVPYDQFYVKSSKANSEKLVRKYLNAA